MGWDYTHALDYKSNGKIDKKAEIISRVDKDYTILKCCEVGSVIYMAARENKTGEISAHVVLTRTDMKDYYNFGTKWMSEDVLPFYYDCPACILDILTPTDDKSSNEWRNRCRARAKEKKNPTALRNLPVGAVIRFIWNGEPVEFTKHPAAYQFKRPFWYNPSTGKYIPAKRIPVDYEVISR